jgi:hypothetical protein
MIRCLSSATPLTSSPSLSFLTSSALDEQAVSELRGSIDKTVKLLDKSSMQLKDETARCGATNAAVRKELDLIRMLKGKVAKLRGGVSLEELQTHMEGEGFDDQIMDALQADIQSMINVKNNQTSNVTMLRVWLTCADCWTDPPVADLT